MNIEIEIVVVAAAVEALRLAALARRSRATVRRRYSTNLQHSL